MSGGATGGALPEELKGELELACGRGGAGDRTSGGARSGGARRKDDEVGRVEIGAVQKIEEFGAELKTEALGQSRVFDDGEIPRGQPGAGNDATPCVAPEA